ncbi:hypothetical protein, partial [Pseudomonas aeruginosa]|uniref:hypothetical protein n=1 Tax=Pseudomonas aeruginosa TaxID=287 RepID=UPI00300CA3AF
MPAALQSAWRGGGRGAAVSLGGVFHEPGGGGGGGGAGGGGGGGGGDGEERGWGVRKKTRG